MLRWRRSNQTTPLRNIALLKLWANDLLSINAAKILPISINNWLLYHRLATPMDSEPCDLDPSNDITHSNGRRREASMLFPIYRQCGHFSNTWRGWQELQATARGWFCNVSTLDVFLFHISWFVVEDWVVVEGDVWVVGIGRKRGAPGSGDEVL